MDENNMNLFSPEYINHVKKMRDYFFRTGSTEGITNVRRDILELWKIAYDSGLDVSTSNKATLPSEEFEVKKQQSATLLRIALPYMNTLCGFLKKDSFWLTLADSDGVVLKLVGSEKAIALANSINLFEGSFRNPSVKNYAGLLWACQYYNRPFQIVATEHSTYSDDKTAGAASPIIDIDTGERIGTICISGYWWESHTHTLGLAILTAEAIAQQFALDRKSKLLTVAHNNLNNALESTDVGIICFDRYGKIFAINRSAMNMLGHTEKKDVFVQKPIFHYLNGIIRKDNLNQIIDRFHVEKSISFDFTPPRRYGTIHCTLRVGDDVPETFFIQLQKQSDIMRLAAASSSSRSAFTFDDIIGTSSQINEAKKLAEIAASYNSSVLIRGESGTGKELFAQAIHNISNRCDKPFIAINCGAIPKSLLESELFGYDPGTFTGGQKGGKAGKFELANGGTLFLDEIGDMPYELQVSLLRAIQSKSIVRVGGNKPIDIDIKIIAATNKNLEDLIRNHTFREDLYYRLKVLSIDVPPLRNRREDIPLLASYFLEKYSRSFDKKITRITPNAISAMISYNWPCNVRELENTIERATIIAASDLITLNDLPEEISRHSFQPLESHQPFAESAQPATAEMTILKELLRERRGNISQVAKDLGISRPTLYKKLKRAGLYEKNKNYSD